MNWHTAQIAFIVALVAVLGIGGMIGLYVAYTTMWSDRWAVRRDDLRQPGGPGVAGRHTEPLESGT